MAITMISQPRSATNPAYNPLVYVFNSNLKGNAQFRYVVNIKTVAAVPFTIADFRVAPRNGDGYGYIDISNVIKNYVDKALILGTTDYDATKDVTFSYQICIGEEYLLTAGYNSIYDLNGFMTLSRVNPHAVTSADIGSQLICTNSITNYPDARQRVNGFQTIRSIPNSNDIQTTTPWSVFAFSGPQTVGGIWRYAGQRNIVVPDQVCITSTVLNAALSLDQFKDYVDSATSPWDNNSAAGQLLTNMPQTKFFATLDQHAYLHVYNRPVTSNTEWCYFTNSNGETFRRRFASVIPVAKGFAVGPGNYGALTPVSGVLPLIKPDTTWYDVQIRNNAGTWVSQTYRFNLDRRCAINPIQILFQDRKSSWLSFAFQLKLIQNIETEKNTYRKEIPKTSTPGWVTIDRGDRGTQTFHSRYRDIYDLNTNWLNEEMSLYFNELLTSAYTYINFGDGKWYGCQVEDKTEQVPLRQNDPLMRRTVRVYPSIENPVQDASTITPFIGKGYNVSDGFITPAPDGWNPRDVQPGPPIG